MTRRKTVLSKSCGKEQCCPVIKVSCRMSKKGKVTDTFTGKDGKQHKYTYESKEPQKICDVKVGSKPFLKAVPSSESGRAIAGLTKQLRARRCTVVVRSNKNA